MIVSFTFSGYLDNYKPTTVYDIINHKDIFVNKLSKEELLRGLKSGKYFLSFEEAVLNCGDFNVEMDDYEVEDE
jgi:hypothetical protein